MGAKLSALRPVLQGGAAIRARRIACLLPLATLGMLASGGMALAAASDASDWSGSGHARARLIGAGTADGRLSAGVEIRLDPDYLTYWRLPGDAGIAPQFDFAGSTNVADVQVEYPAPRRLDEAGATAFGYEGAVTFPLRVTRRDPAHPATLSLVLDYAICATQCLPAKARASLTLPDQGSPATRALVDEALARVPRSVSLGGPGPLSIDTVEAASPEDPPRLLVRAHASAAAELFVEAPEGWYLQAGRPIERDGLVFAIDVLEHPAGARLETADLRLTLVDLDGAIEVRARAAPVAPTP